MDEKEDLISQLFQQNQGSMADVHLNIGNVGRRINKRKFENHLSSNLKRQIRELKYEMSMKDDEISTLKKDLKSTKLSEMDLELRTYMDECMRL